MPAISLGLNPEDRQDSRSRAVEPAARLVQNWFRMLPLTMRRATVGACLLLPALGCGPTSERGRRDAPATVASFEARETTSVAVGSDTIVTQPRYRVVAIPTRRALEELWRELGPERFLLTLKVNRRDSLHVRDRDSLMVPDSSARILDLSPFPRELPSARELRKLVVVSR